MEPRTYLEGLGLLAFIFIASAPDLPRPSACFLLDVRRLRESEALKLQVLHESLAQFDKRAW